MWVIGVVAYLIIGSCSLNTQMWALVGPPLLLAMVSATACFAVYGYKTGGRRLIENVECVPPFVYKLLLTALVAAILLALSVLALARLDKLRARGNAMPLKDG